MDRRTELQPASVNTVASEFGLIVIICFGSIRMGVHAGWIIPYIIGIGQKGTWDALTVGGRVGHNTITACCIF
ncbi:hypothetical protein D3C76_1753500 [compost metagenome]